MTLYWDNCLVWQGPVSQLCGFGLPFLDCIGSLAQWGDLLGQIQDPPTGPTATSRAAHSEGLFVLVKETQMSLQKNLLSKWNVSMWAFVATANTNIISSVNIQPPLYAIIWRLITHLLPYYLFLHCFFDFSLCCESFLSLFLSFWAFSPFFPHLNFMLFIGQIRSTPLFYRSVSSPLLWE